jgi:hypothetical protein
MRQSKAACEGKNGHEKTQEMTCQEGEGEQPKEKRKMGIARKRAS